MAYLPPSLRIEQEFVPRPASNTLPLYGCMIGPHYGLHRFSEEDEKAELGAYDPVSGNTYTAWPDKALNSTVDVATSSVWVEDAVLRYHQFSQIAGSGVGLLTDDGNRIRTGGATPYVFKTANGTDRSAVYGNRDVAIGDWLRVYDGAKSLTIDTQVIGLVADTVAATVAATASAASSNKANTVVGGTFTGHFSATPTGTASGVAYNGLADGYPSETYTCTVTSTDGTAANTYVSIVSASGTDNVASKKLSASGVPTVCGTRGATFTVTAGANDIVVGDWFVVEVAQNYTAPTLSCAGTYLGTRNTTYIVAITEGGTVDTDTIKFRVTTNNGFDIAPEVEVAANGIYAVGNYGVTIDFDAADQLVTGDQYTVAVTAAGDGPVRTVVTADNMTGMDAADDVQLTFGLRDTFELEPSQWEATTALITVAAAAQHTDTYLGTTQNFYIEEGTLYMDYRELLLDGVNSVGSLSDPLDVEDTLGPVVPENPIAMLMYAALTGSNGTACYYVITGGETLSAYQDALEILTETFEVYSLVPWNTDRAICDLIASHCDAMSSPDLAYFRRLYKGIDLQRLVSFYAEDGSGNELLATISGTTLACTNADFVVAGVRIGDTVRINFQPGLGGVQTYDSYVVASNPTATGLTLVTGPSTPITVPIKMEVWRTQTLNEYAAAIAADANHYSSRRVTAVWSEPMTMLGNADLPKSVLGALIAGMRSAMAPHQPLTNINIEGIDLVPVNNFGSYQLNLMAGSGTWLVVKDVEGNIYTRHQLTTDMFDLKTQEETMTTNLDHICRDFKTAVRDLYGRGNATQAMLNLIRSRIYSQKSSIQSRSYPDTIGAQIEDMTITKLYIDTVLKDHIYCELDTTLPYPLNNLTLKFRLI